MKAYGQQVEIRVDEQDIFSQEGKGYILAEIISLGHIQHTTLGQEDPLRVGQKVWVIQQAIQKMPTGTELITRGSIMMFE